MMTVVIRVDRDRPNPEDIARAAECLRRGGLVAFPTETVYGLGVHASTVRPCEGCLAPKDGRPTIR